MSRLRDRRWLLLTLGVPAAYGLAVGLMTFPAPLHLTDRLIGNNIDNWIFYWNNWWLGQALREGHNWFFTPYLFHPQGASLLAHSISFLNSLIALALKPAVGPVAAYNLSFLLGLWVGGIGMFCLMYELTRSPAGSFLSGLVFTFAPYHLTQVLAQLHLGSIQWWPFFALFLHRAMRRRSWNDGAFAGLFAGLTLWSGLQLALLLLLWTPLRLGWYALFEFRPDGGKKGWLRLGGVIGVCIIAAVLVGLPLLLPLLRGWTEITEATLAFDESSTNQTDLLAYLVPPTYHPLVGAQVNAVYELFVANRAIMPYLGYTTLGLAAIGLIARYSTLRTRESPSRPDDRIWRRSEPLFWAATGVIWLLLAAGSVLRVGGRLYPAIPLPYRVIDGIFPLSAIRNPDRFNLLVVFSFAALPGLGAAWLGRRRRWMLPLLLLLVMLEYVPVPLPMWDLPAVSPFIARMAGDPSSYAVLDYPMDYSLSKLWLYEQTLHGKPVIQGHVSRYTTETYGFIISHPLLAILYRDAEKPPRLPAIPTPSEPFEPALGPALRSLEAEGVRYILVHEPWMDDDHRTRFHRVVPLVPTYKDELLSVYDLRHPLPLLYDDFPTPLSTTAALARLEVKPETEGGWRVQVVALALAADPPSLSCRVALEGEGRAVEERTVELFGPAAPSLVEGDLWLAEATFSSPPDLPAGAYRWVLECASGGRYVSPDSLMVSEDGSRQLLRRRLDLRYGGLIRLGGYRWWVEGADLHLELEWEALADLDTDYKVFVHLLDRTGELLCQHDAMPCDWGCPTAGWQAGQIIQDEAVLSLWGLPPGRYRLAVGLYDAATGERLDVREGEGAEIPNGYPFLPEPFTIRSLAGEP